MRVVRVVTLAVLAAVLAGALLIAQAAVSARLTLLNPAYMLNAVHRQGALAVLYGGAAQFIADPENGLSESDQAAATRALEAMIDDQALERVVDAGIASLGAFWRGSSAAVSIDLAETKTAMVAHLARFGGSPEALDRLREAFADVPDTVLVADRSIIGGAPFDLWALLHLSLVLVSVLAVFGLIGMIALAGDASAALAWIGAAIAAAGGAALAASMRLHSLVVGSATLLPGLPQLQLPAKTQLELAAALTGLVRQLAAQLRLVPAVVLALGALALAAGLWLAARANQVSGSVARRSAAGS